MKASLPFLARERLSGHSFFPSWVAKEHHARFSFVASYVTGQDVIDCACGTGEGANLFAQTAQTVTGIDISTSAISEASTTFSRKNLSFREGDALSLSVATDSVDVYVSLETIEHIDDDKAYLREAKRILKKGGLFICSTPNRRVTNPHASLQDKPINPFHIREYTTLELTQLLEATFTKVEIYGLNRNRHWKVDLLTFGATWLPKRWIARLHQATKLVTSFRKREGDYRVEQLRPEYEYEYIVAVCQRT